MEARKANKERRAEDTVDFQAACRAAGWRSSKEEAAATPDQSDASTATAATAVSPLHTVSLSLNRGNGKDQVDPTLKAKNPKPKTLSSESRILGIKP